MPYLNAQEKQTAARFRKDETSGGASGAAKGTCYLFRITARGFGASTRTNLLGGQPDPLVEVVLQSYFQLFVK
jgi:Tfp pilus assembly protein PilX